MRSSLHLSQAVGLCVVALCAVTTRAVADDPDPDPDKAISIDDVDEDDRDHLFLRLGKSRDYLGTERHRIIDQIEAAIPSLYEPIRPFHGYTLPPGAWRVGLRTTFGHNPSDYGTDDFYSKFFEDVDVDFVRTELDIFHGFELGGIRDLTARLTIPHKTTRLEGDGHPFRIDSLVTSMDGTSDGLGDIKFTLKKKWVDQANGPLTFATMLGVIFPTAQDDEQLSSAQTLFVNGTPMAVSNRVPGNPALDIFSRKAGDQLFPRIAQPGNGSWGVRLGFGATRQFERSALHAGLVFDSLSDNDGITPGDELRYGVSYVIPPFASDHITLDLSVFGRWKGDEEFPGLIMHPVRDPATGGPIIDPATGMPQPFTTARPDFKHGNVLFASPALVYTPSPGVRLFVAPAFRIAEPRRGPSPEWLVTVGATFTF